jgi:outer membrane receptor for ferrienterochelin and colicins
MRLFTLLIFLFFVIPSNANTYPLQIEVRDLVSGEPVAGATMHLNGQHFISNEKGYIVIEAAASGKVKITAVGYKELLIDLDASQRLQTLNLMPLAGELHDVVVSSSMRPMQRMASPIPVESYAARFFKRNPTPNIFDAVGMINGVQSQITCNVCNTGEIRINGLDGPYTMVLIDGMPIVSSLSTVYGLSGIPNSMVKRIEVVKGPASTLYGSEAVAGIINIITVDPLTSHALSADISGTTMGEWNADISTKFKMKKANALLGINHFNYANPIDVNGDNFTDITLQKRFSVFNKWSFDRPNNLPASFAMRLLTENRWGGEMQWTSNFKGSDSLYGESIDTRRAEIMAQYGLSKELLAEASYNYHYQDSYYGTDHYMGKQHTAFGQIRWLKQSGKNHWLAGLPVRIIQYDDNTPATEKENGVNAPSLQTMVGAFVQNEHQFTSKISMLSGLRYEHTNIQGGVFAPRLALKWQPAATQTFRISGGNGFRIVNLFTEDHAALSGFREVVIKEELKPERSWNINTNYTAQVHSSKALFNFDVSGFYTWFNNRIIPDYDTDPQKIIYANLDGQAISRGFSANVDWIHNKGLRAGLGATYMDVFVAEENTEGIMEKTALVYAPKWSGSYFLSYPIKKWNTNIDLTGTFTGPMRLPVFPNDFRPEFSPWYTVLNLQVTKKFNHVEFYVSAKNLLNFLPQNPILHPDDPFDRPGGKYWLADGNPNPLTNPNGFSFDPTYNYAPMQGLRILAGIRLSFH